VRVAAHAGVRQINDIDPAARFRDLAYELDAVLPDLRPARVERDLSP